MKWRITPRSCLTCWPITIGKGGDKAQRDAQMDALGMDPNAPDPTKAFNEACFDPDLDTGFDPDASDFDEH